MEKIELVTPEQLEVELARCLASGRFPDCFLYLGIGAKNWLSLDSSRDFPIAADLKKLLSDSREKLMKHIYRYHNLMSIGVGSGQKERILLAEMTRHRQVRYWCVDISRELVEKAMAAVADLDIQTIGVVAYLEDMDKLASLLQRPVILSLFGNNFCNYEPDSLLPTIREKLGDDDLFLFDANLFSDVEKVDRAYKSELNTTFNVGPLVARGLPMKNFSFDLELLHWKTSVGPTYRTRKSLYIKKDTDLTIADRHIHLDPGQRIEMGFTYKFDREHLIALLEKHDFEIIETQTSASKENILILAGKKQR